MSASRSHAFVVGYTYLLLTQAVARVLPFIVNTLVARRLTPEEFGVPTVHFHLLSTVILTCREGFRRALMRDSIPKHIEHNVIDREEMAGWLVVPAGAIISAGVPAFIYLAGRHALDDAYAKAVMLYSIAAFLELFAEPFYIRAQRRSQFRLRLATETVATLSRSFITFYFVARPNMGASVPLAFAYGQLAYALCLVSSYTSVHMQLLAVGAKLLRGAEKIEWNTLTLVGSFSLQAVWKLLLAEGEKAALMWSGSMDSQGIYALVSSLGSLVVRIVLQPFEEAAFISFAQAGTSQKEKTRVFTSLLRVAILFGLVTAMHGPQYSRLVLSVLYGDRWADADGAENALGGYSLLIAFFAVNGITEAFAHAVMIPAELTTANKVLLIASIINMTIAIGLQPRIGALGLIIANCVSMTIRISYTVYFVFFDRFKSLASCSECLPHRNVLLLLCLTSASTALSRAHSSTFHVAAGLFSMTFILAVIARYEASSISSLRHVKRLKRN